MAFGDQRANIFLVRRVDAGVRRSRIENIGCMQESRALHADVDECRLHPRQYARYAALVNIADQSAAAGALQKYFLQNALFHAAPPAPLLAGIPTITNPH